MESLETRRLLAGNVAVTVESGRLSIIGDSLGNEVFVGQTAEGQFIVHGMNGTSINGRSDVVFVTGVTGNTVHNMFVGLKEGNDRFLFSSESDWNNGNPFSEGWGGPSFKPLFHEHGYAYLSGQLTVDLGVEGFDTAVVTASTGVGMRFLASGQDDDGLFVRTNPERVTGSIEATLGGASDHVALSLENVVGPVSLGTGSGNDKVWVAFRTAPNLLLDTGNGSDQVIVEGGWEWPKTQPPTSPMPINGTQNTIIVRSGTGDDNIELTQLFAHSLFVNAGSGKDDVVVRGINMRGNVNIRGGGTIGSSTELTDYLRRNQGRIDGMFSMPAGAHVETKIGGNVTVQSNFDRFIPGVDPVGARNSVVLGQHQEDNPQQSADDKASGFTVGGNVNFFGTIYEDDLTIQPLTAANIAADLGYGEDRVNVRGVAVAHDVSINLNDGNDLRLIVEDAGQSTPARIGGNLRVDFGSGNEQTGIPIEGGPVTETFIIGARASGVASNFVVGGQLQVIGGSGLNDLQVTASQLGSVDLQMGSESSDLDMRVFRVAGSLTATGGIFADRWNFSAFHVSGDMTLATGDGNDDIRTNERIPLPSEVAGSLSIDSGIGHDKVYLGPAAISREDYGMLVGNDVSIVSGNGFDDVSLNRVRIVDQLMALLGAGNDKLRLFGVQVRAGVLDGGPQHDEVSGSYRHGANQPGLLRRGFEVDSLTGD